MIPAEIVQIGLLLVFFALWLIQKAKTHEARAAQRQAEERVRALELENASLSGALTDRSPLDPPGKGWTRPPEAPRA